MTRAEGRLLGVDPGQVRIGLALSDPLGLTAQPLRALRSIGPRRDVEAIADVAREHDVGTIVIGLPRLLSGEEGEAAARARDLADRVRRRLRGGVTVELWDERLTTVEVERTMVDAGVGRTRRREAVDTLAATLILQSYLDARASRRAAEPGSEG